MRRSIASRHEAQPYRPGRYPIQDFRPGLFRRNQICASSAGIDKDKNTNRVAHRNVARQLFRFRERIEDLIRRKCDTRGGAKLKTSLLVEPTLTFCRDTSGNSLYGPDNGAKRYTSKKGKIAECILPWWDRANLGGFAAAVAVGFAIDAQ